VKPDDPTPPTDLTASDDETLVAATSEMRPPAPAPDPAVDEPPDASTAPAPSIPPDTLTSQMLPPLPPPPPTVRVVLLQCEPALQGLCEIDEPALPLALILAPLSM